MTREMVQAESPHVNVHSRVRERQGGRLGIKRCGVV